MPSAISSDLLNKSFNAKKSTKGEYNPKGRLTRGRAVTILTDLAKPSGKDDFEVTLRVTLGGVGLGAVVAIIVLFALALFSLPIGPIVFGSVLGGAAIVGGVIGFAVSRVLVNSDPTVEKIKDQIAAWGKSNDFLTLNEMKRLTEQVEASQARTELWNVFNQKTIKAIPSCFRCPLTNCEMMDPVVAANGKSYERWAFLVERKRNPQFQANSICYENRALREAFEEYKKWKFDEKKNFRYFECPISLEVMQDPVIDPYGNSYEREQIFESLILTPIDPLARRPLHASQLIPNVALKEAILAWQARK